MLPGSQEHSIATESSAIAALRTSIGMMLRNFWKEGEEEAA
jgi:hypothetical protein